MRAHQRAGLENAAADLRRVAQATYTLAPSASVKASALAQEIELRIRKLDALAGAL